jgi:hypothetical protein
MNTIDTSNTSHSTVTGNDETNNAASIGAFAPISAVPVAGGPPPGPVGPRLTVLYAKIAIAFLSGSTDNALVLASARIVDALTSNPVYPAPLPKLDVVVATRNAYVAAVNALDRSRKSVAVRNEARAALVQVLRDLALYVQHTSGGDRVKLTASGYPLQQARRPSVGLPTIPTNVRLRRTRVGNQLLAMCDPVVSARAYQWRFASTQAPTVWTQPDPISKARFVLEDLVAGTTYIVQVRAFSTRGPGDWSDSATMMAA